MRVREVMSDLSRKLMKKYEKKDAVTFGSMMIEETFHAVNIHMYYDIVNCIADHNPSIKNKIINLFANQVLLDEHYFGFSMDNRQIADTVSSYAASMTFSKLNSIECIMSNPRKFIFVYKKVLLKEPYYHYYLSIDFTEGFKFSAAEKDILFFHLRNRLNWDRVVTGIAEIDFEALAYSYMCNLVMMMQVICEQEFTSFRRIFEWDSDSDTKRLFIYHRSGNQYNIATQKTRNSVYNFMHMLQKYATKISRAIFNLEQKYMHYNLDELENQFRNRLTSACDESIMYLNYWFRKTGLQGDSFNSIISDAIFRPRHMPINLNSSVIISYEFENSLGAVYRITDRSVKRNLTTDMVENFDGEPLYSELVTYLNLMKIDYNKLDDSYSTVKKEEYQIGKYHGYMINSLIRVYSRDLAHYYQCSGFHIEKETLKPNLGRDLLDRAINKNEVMTSNELMQIMNIQAMEYTTATIEKCFVHLDYAHMSTILTLIFEKWGIDR